MKFDYIKVIENRLSEEETEQLKSIYAPTVVAVPLTDARRCVCVTEEGEIRAYGVVGESPECPDGKKAYLSSFDGGVSWKTVYGKAPMDSARFFPKVHRYIGIDERDNALYVVISDKSIDDPDPRYIKVTDGRYIDSFLPNGSQYSDRIWFSAQKQMVSGVNYPIGFFYSDDFGETWTAVELPPIEEMPVTFPDKGARWIRCGSEPVVEEIAENCLMMLIRNGWDAFYKAYSYDGGETWTKPVSSTFYGHATTPFLLKLSDGGVIALWNNTRILPELDHNTQIPPLGQSIINGTWEDVFTNRDAAHAALSRDNGKTFTGYREILLNPIRNRSDFRTCGPWAKNLDKSVHQFQAWELPYGKILVAVGQNAASRRMLIFDVNWLTETGRSEDFRRGMEQVSTHQYLFSLSGSRSKTDDGHCAWNRVSGAVMAPDPTGCVRECVHISRVEDPRVFTKTQGLVWNFPMSRSGVFTAEVMAVEDTLRLILSDRWVNPSDDFLPVTEPYCIDLSKEDIGEGFRTVTVSFDVDNECVLYVDGERRKTLSRLHEVPTGISYAVLQCIAPSDSEGFYLRRVEKE